MRASGCANFVTEVITVPAFVSECYLTRIAVVMMSGVDLIRNSGGLKVQGTRALAVAGIEAGPIYPGVEFLMRALARACTKP